MLWVFMDPWDIVDYSMETAHFNSDYKVLNDYQRRVKKSMSMIGFNLINNQLAHIKNCKRPAEA